MYRRRRAYLKSRPKIEPKSKKRIHYKIKPIGGDKNGGTRLIQTRKSHKWYPTQDVPRKFRNRHTQKPMKLRKSISPGTVLILLAGRHQGKRVIFLKQLPSGLLLVTGPYKVNRVPLRRIDQAYVIATRTKVDVSTVKLPDRLYDDYFKRKKTDTKSRGKKASIFQDTDTKYKVSDERREDQKEVDTQILPIIRQEECLRSYLRHKFSLSTGQYPHKMIF